MPPVEAGFPGLEGLITYGPVLEVRIGLAPKYMSGKETRPGLPHTSYPALVDTGATHSCVDSVLALSISLPVVGRARIAGVGGQSEVNEHLAQIEIPALDFTVYRIFDGVHLRSGGIPYAALLGRDFLQHVTLVYNGRTGSVVISND